MNYNFNTELLKTDIVVHTKTKEQLETLIAFVDKSFPDAISIFKPNQENTCIFLKHGGTEWSYSSYTYFFTRAEKYGKIYEFEEILLPTEQTLPKEPSMQTKQYLKVFTKEKQLNVKGLIYQIHHLKEFKDPRDFVSTLITEEMLRVAQQISSLALDDYYGYNVKFKSIINTLKTHKTEQKDINTETVIAYYEYEKLSKLPSEYHDKFKWIADYLTHEIVNTKNPVILFKSNKFTITIDNADIILNETLSPLTYVVPIQYSTSTNSFFI